MGGCSSLVTQPPALLSNLDQPEEELTREPLPRPPNNKRIIVGVYGCYDSTGQKKVTPTGNADFSTALLQDCNPLLSSGFLRYSSHYQVIERGRMDELLKERQIAQAMYGENSRAMLGNLVISDVLLFGQILSYDKNERQRAGGFGFNGFGFTSQQVSDRIIFGLRAVSTKTGEVLSSVLVSKTVNSLQIDGHIISIMGLNQVSLEEGNVFNEPAGIALSRAIDLAIYQLTKKGLQSGWWSG